MTRPSWDTVWSEVAEVAGTRSLCVRAQIGTVIVSADNRVQSVSFNGAPDSIDCHGLPCTEWCERARTNDPDPTYDNCGAVHAEANAISRANWDRIQGGTVYSNGATCMNCAKLIAAAGIAKVVHRVNESDAHRNPERVEEYLRLAGIEVVRC